MTGQDSARRAAEMAARQSYGKLVAFLGARTGDVAAAEDALADAFAAALATWPTQGVPRSPEAWLLTAARRKLIDTARRRRTSQALTESLTPLLEEAADTDDATVPDWRLRLLFVCAHPAIDTAAHAPLMLQTVLGFDAGAIAAAFLTSPAAMGQRLVRAKRRIREAGIPFRVPEREELPARLDAVLGAIYAAFAAGWADPAGLDLRRQGLVEEAIWLGRVLVGLLPDEPEGLGLLALMLHAGARSAARRTGAGDYIPLGEQDPGLWDRTAIEEAERLLWRSAARGQAGRFQIEAAIQSVHAARRISGRTDWRALVTLYDGLLALGRSPVVVINRAVALAEADDAAAGLAALDAIADDPRLAAYQPYWAARADLLARTGADGLARDAYDRALALESDPAVRRFLAARRAGIGQPAT